MRWFSYVLVVGCAIASIASAQGQPAEPRRLPLLGVYDATSGSPIQGAVVRDTLGTEALTSKDGVVPLNFITPVGPFYLIEIRKIGYRPLHLKIRADSLGDRTEVLEPLPLGAATELPTVNINEKYNLNLDPGLRDGFAARCQSKLVTCFREDELRAHPASSLYDFIKKTSGTIPDCGSTINRSGGRVRRPTGPGNKTLDCLKMRRVPPAGDPVCVPTFYVDGFLRGFTTTTLDEIDDSLGPLEVTGIEVYLGGQSVPLKYAAAPGNPGCGAVVIWTK